MNATHVKVSEVLRLADGGTIEVTRQSWKRFLMKLENNLLTNQSASTYVARPEDVTVLTDGLLRQV